MILRRPVVLTILSLFAIAVLICDLLTPDRFVVWVWYLPVIFAAVLFNNARYVSIASLICSAFVVVGMFITPQIRDPRLRDVLTHPPGLHEPRPRDAVNRSMGLAALWLMTLAGLTIVRRSSQVNAAMKRLEDLIARHQHAERALAQSEERLRFAVAGAGMGAWDVDLRTGETTLSNFSFRLPGYEPDRGGRTNWERWLAREHSEDLERAIQNHQRTRSQQSMIHSEIRIRRAASDELTWLSLYGRFVHDESGEPARFVGVSFDITQQKELQREVLDIVAREQRRIGEELHDSVAQELTGLGLIANSLALRIDPSDPASDIAGRLVDGLTRVHEQVRALSHGMVPFHLEAGGLQPALRDLVERAGEQSGVAIRFESAAAEVADRTTARQLLRVAQESVNNAIKHARASHILITLDSDDDGVYMQIQDDGDGMMPRAKRVEGLGIRIMRYRMNLIGGSFRIDSELGRGTRVSCTIPRRLDDGSEKRGARTRRPSSESSYCG